MNIFEDSYSVGIVLNGQGNGCGYGFSNGNGFGSGLYHDYNSKLNEYTDLSGKSCGAGYGFIDGDGFGCDGNWLFGKGY